MTINEARRLHLQLRQSDSPQLDTELLLCHCLLQPRTYLRTWPDQALTPQQEQQFLALMARREAGEPVAYLLGEREFWSLPLRVNTSTLIPRPDTELLVETALSLNLSASSRLVDLGTGTGAIALALAKEQPQWKILAVDRSAEACALAQQNAQALHLAISVQQSDWFSALSGPFDAILSNPPYLAQTDPHLAQGDLRFEPASALVAGPDGLADLRQIIAQAPQYLKPGGWLLLEHGWQQAEAVRRLLAEAGFESISSRRDLANHERISLGQRPLEESAGGHCVTH
jgi:release factor glutamine methyltransferase